MMKILKNCRDESELPNVINSNYGIGVEFTNDSGTFITVQRERKREIILEVTSWIGTSPGAIHYYGKMIVYDPNVKVLKSKSDSKEVGKIMSIGGYFPRPVETQSIEIELIKLITDKELKTERFEDYHKGEYTPNFNTKKEVIELGKKIFKERFKGDWKLRIDE